MVRYCNRLLSKVVQSPSVRLKNKPFSALGTLQEISWLWAWTLDKRASRKSLLTSTILWLWLVLPSYFTTSVLRSDFTNTIRQSLQSFFTFAHFSDVQNTFAASGFDVGVTETFLGFSSVQLNWCEDILLPLKENILERHCLTCRDWLRLFPFVWRIIIFLHYNFEVELRNQHCRVVAVKERQGWAQIILEWKKNKITSWYILFRRKGNRKK